MQARVSAELGIDVLVVESALFGLVGTERESAIEGLTSGLPLPFVIGLGSLICTGDIDGEAIIEAVQRKDRPMDRAPD